MTVSEIHALPGWVCCTFDSETMELTSGGEIDSADIRFPWASVTKTFTAHLCLQPGCRELLDTPIREVLPYFSLQDETATREMTPRDALCHYSGLDPHTEDWVRCDLSREAYIRDRLPRLPSAGPFREKHRYSNLIYAVLGQWLAQIRGNSWEELITREILQPLGMRQSGHLDEQWTELCPPPHALNSSGNPERIPPFYVRNNHLIAPASELSGSLEDLGRWGQRMLQVDPEDERWRPHNLVSEQHLPDQGPLHYGLGWRLDRVKAEPRVWHSGQCSGYSSLLCLYPRSKTGFAAAANLSGAVEALWQLASTGAGPADPRRFQTKI